MITRRIACLLSAAIVTGWAMLVIAPGPSAAADPCPDVEVIFARATDEPPGVGVVGQAFIDALQPIVGTRSLGIFPVAYAASSNFSNRMAFATSVLDGIRNAGTHVEWMAANCPNTRIVLGGHSQGAVVAGFVTAAEIPPGVPAALVPKPMAPEVADHVAAVVLFGRPSDQFLSDVGAPLVVIGPLYVPKTIDLCVPTDLVCNGASPGPTTATNTEYATNGMAVQAADFAGARL